MKAIGLVRVSTKEQDEEGVSLDAQEAKIRAYCKLYDIELVAIFRDTGSGKDMDREGLQKALKMLRDNAAEGIVVAKLDRLTRSLRDLQFLLEEYFTGAGFTLCLIEGSIDTRTAMGRGMLNVMMTMLQMERELIGERTRDALRYKKSQGQRTGSVPFGKDLAEDGITLTDNTFEQMWLKQIKDWRVVGHSLQWIADKLNENGVPTKKSGQMIMGKPVSGKWSTGLLAKFAK